MKRILAIDGGGLRGVIPATFLAEIEDRLGDRVSRYFDLIAGTSTGGLIALGLGLGLSAGQVLKFYEEWGPRIFPRRRGPRLVPRGYMASLYNLEALRQAVEAALGRQPLENSRCRLLITAFDLKQGKAHLWRTPHAPGAGGGDVVDVALSTSAAPVYFEPYRSPKGLAMVDGGVWATCPVLLAVTEGIGTLGWRPAEIFVLSLGCSFGPFRENDQRPVGGGILRWGARLFQLFLAAQEDAALAMARQICGTDNVVRIDPVDPTGSQAVDNPGDIPRFRKMGKEAAEAAFSKLKPLFFEEPAEPFVPLSASEKAPT